MTEFLVPAACIRTLAQPADFYQLLLCLCQQARARVTLSSLYLGTGLLEHALLSALRARLLAAPEVRAVLHFDLGRTLRRTGPEGGGAGTYASSAALLLELLNGGGAGRSAPLGERARIDLTQLPALRGALGAVAAPRVSEALGVWHAKAYVFDHHTAILTGANLSTDYFTTRQDRYVVVSSSGGAGGAAGELAVRCFIDYLHSTFDSLGAIPGGYRLHCDGTVRAVGAAAAAAAAAAASGPAVALPLAPQPSSPIRHIPLPFFSPLHSAYSRELQRILRAASSPTPMGSLPASSSSSSQDPPAELVALRPRWQLGSLGVRCDEAALTTLLRTALAPAPAASLHLATGYFNLPTALQALIIGPRGASTCVHALTASPLANGFWGAAGVAGAVPLAYCQLERVFYRAAERAGRLMADPEGAPRAPGIALHEYERAGWTFHAKGLWLQGHGGGEGGDTMTSIVGSSNYGMRGTHRDLELQVEMCTQAPSAVAALCGERDALFRQPHVRAVGGHLSASLGYGRERDVFSAAVTPHRALLWRRAWANGVWIHAGFRILKPFF